MNSPFVVEQAKHLAARPDVGSQNDPALRVQRIYRVVLGRSATREETELGLAFVQCVPNDDASGASRYGSHPLNPWEQFAQVLLLSNEFLFVD